MITSNSRQLIPSKIPALPICCDLAEHAASSLSLFAYLNQIHHSGGNLLFPTLYPLASYLTIVLLCYTFVFFSLSHELTLNPLYVMLCLLAFFFLPDYCIEPYICLQHVSFPVLPTPRRQKYNNKNVQLCGRTRCNL